MRVAVPVQIHRNSLTDRQMPPAQMSLSGENVTNIDVEDDLGIVDPGRKCKSALPRLPRRTSKERFAIIERGKTQMLD